MLSQLLESSPWPGKPGSRTAFGPFHGSADSLLIGELAGAQRLPVGVVTHLLGGPFFLFLLLRERRVK